MRLDREAQQTQSLRQLVSAAEKDAAALTAQLKAAQDNLVEQRKLLDDAQAQLRTAFASVSQEALAKNNEAFLALAKERFAQLSTEATGSLDVMLSSVAEFLDEQVETRMARILSLVEPLMLVFMGVVVAILLISIYMPLFSSLGQSKF